MNRNTGTFFNMLEKVGTKNNFSDTPGNIFIFDDSGIQINNKPNSVIAEKRSINVHVLTLGEKSENITVTAVQILPPILIYEVVKKKREFGDRLPLGFRRVLEEPEIAVHRHSLIHHVVHRALPQKQNFLERPSTFGFSQSQLIAAPLYCFRLL